MYFFSFLFVCHVSTFSKVKPVSVTYGIGIAEHDGEGRVITTEFDRFYLVNTYIPNAGQKLERYAGPTTTTKPKAGSQPVSV
jgi:exodeoxyribonuclease-3